MISTILFVIATVHVGISHPIDKICIKSCAGLANGNYQSCQGCSVFATCSNGNLHDNLPCSGATVWDDEAKLCLDKSETCETAEEQEFTGIVVRTGNDYKYHYVHDLGVDVTNKTYVTFSVQACNDAHIALSETKGQDSRDTYEIVIGGWGNSASALRDCKQCTNMDEMRIPLYNLNCNEQRPYWISWSNGYIRVGSGSDVGKYVFMAWNDPNPHPVNYIAVATGWGATGIWTFSIEKDCLASCIGVANGNYQSCNTCSGYVACSGGTLSNMPCPGGLSWDDTLKRCDHVSSTCTPSS